MDPSGGNLTPLQYANQYAVRELKTLKQVVRDRMKTRKTHSLYGKDHTHVDTSKKPPLLCGSCKGVGKWDGCMIPCDHCLDKCESEKVCPSCGGEGIIDK